MQLANAGGQIVLSAGASDVCTREGDLSWDIAVRFDGGDYVREIFPQILDGSAVEGDIIVYSPGEEPDVAGAVICDATAEQQTSHGRGVCARRKRRPRCEFGGSPERRSVAGDVIRRG